MEELHLPHAKLLYAVNNLLNEKRISAEESVLLKDLIISEDPELAKVLQDNPDEKILKDRLQEHARGRTGEELKTVEIPIPPYNPDIKEMTSPTDNSLLIARRYERGKKESLPSQLIKGKINHCEIGNSPTTVKSDIISKAQIGYEDDP